MSSQKGSDSPASAWKNWGDWAPDEPSETRKADLEDASSLTQRLIQASGGDFRVQVVNQDWEQVADDEAKVLGLAVGEQALVREVELVCNGQAWVLARSVIPKSSLQDRLADITELGAKPLGAMLFKEPSLERTSFEIRRFNEASLRSLGHFNLDKWQPAWGRRSVFRVEGLPVLVAEIFLDSCPSLR